MLNIKRFEKFIGAANKAHQQFSLWFSATNEFAKHQQRWNRNLTKREQINGCRYKNFWNVTLASLQHGWILAIARLFDPAHASWDKKETKPRICLDYLLKHLRDRNLAASIQTQMNAHQPVIDSTKDNRNNWLAHLDDAFQPIQIKAGVENLFGWLEDVIASIKKSELHLSNSSKIINVSYNEQLSQCGADEIFNDLLLAEKSI